MSALREREGDQRKVDCTDLVLTGDGKGAKSVNLADVICTSPLRSRSSRTPEGEAKALL